MFLYIQGLKKYEDNMAMCAWNLVFLTSEVAVMFLNAFLLISLSTVACGMK